MAVSPGNQSHQSLSQSQIWLLAARPKTLPAAAAPVLVGTAVAISDGGFAWLPALAALLGALLLQIGANLANDVFDYQKGADTSERLGPLRVTQAGLLSPRAMFQGMTVVFGLATLIGLYLVWVGGWPVVAIGAFSILAAIAYTGGPFPLGYHGLGDVFVFLFFGLIAVGGTYYVQTLTLTPKAIWAALPIGLLATAILVVNNLRDLQTDRAAGKKTLAVRLGQRGAQMEYTLLLALSYLVPLLMWLIGLSTVWVLLSWVSLLLARPLLQQIYTQQGRSLNLALANTARLELAFALLFSLGLILSF